MSMMRDEADICHWTVAHLFTQGVDAVYVLDNNSKDDTGLILEQDGCVVVDDPEVAYNQSAKMTALAARACEPGDWCIPFDADELWTGLGKLRDIDADVVATKPWVHVPQPGEDGANPYVAYQHRQVITEPQWKVAFRWVPGARIEMGNHGVVGAGGNWRHDVLDIRHFQYRDLEQVRRKVSQGVEAYDATSMPSTFGTHWRDLNALSDKGLADWWATYTSQDVVHDPAPWHVPGLADNG